MKHIPKTKNDDEDEVEGESDDMNSSGSDEDYPDDAVYQNAVTSVAAVVAAVSKEQLTVYLIDVVLLTRLL